MEDGIELDECSAQVDKPGDRLDCLATFFRLKRTSRLLCRKMEYYRYRIARLRRLKKQLQQEHHCLNDYRISCVDGLLADAKDRQNFQRTELVKVGAQVFEALQHADSLLSFHDKCQVMGRDHRGVANQMERDNIPGDARFSDMVDIYCLEYNGTGDRVPLYSPAMPLYTAYHIFFAHQMIHNKELLSPGKEMLEEMFPGLPWHEIQIDHRREGDNAGSSLARAGA